MTMIYIMYCIHDTNRYIHASLYEYLQAMMNLGIKSTFQYRECPKFSPGGVPRNF